MEKMETLLDTNYFNPLNDAFVYDDQTPLFDSEFLFETPLICRDTLIKSREIKSTGKRKQPSKTTQRENEEPKEFVFKPWCFESLDNSGMYDEDMRMLDDVFISESITIGGLNAPLKKAKTNKAKSESKQKTKSKKISSVKSTLSIKTTLLLEGPNLSSPKAGVRVAKTLSPKQRKLAGSKTKKISDSRNSSSLKTGDMSDLHKAALSRKRPRNRMKWSKDENSRLWESISKHGNNWTEIKKELACRTYYQIKDKGRRLLSVQGWISGRNKKYSHEAMYSAKLIALNVIAQRKEDEVVQAAA